MSIQAVAAVLDADVPNVRMKMLLVCLANAHNVATGACFPTAERLARESGMPVSTVRKWLGILERDGHIKVKSAYDPDTGRQLANSYTISMLGEVLPGSTPEVPRGSRGEVLPGSTREVPRGSRGRGHRVAGGGATLVAPSIESTGRNTRKARAGAAAREAKTEKVSRVTDPDLFAECERLVGKSSPVSRDGAWFFPSDLVDRARGNLLRAGEEGDAA